MIAEPFRCLPAHRLPLLGFLVLLITSLGLPYPTAALGQDALPAVERHEAPLVSPRQAEKILAKRQAPVSTLQKGLALAPLAAVTAADAEIVELARALKNNPDLIYAYVHDQIAYEPLYGALKGPLGTLLDKRGNDFDQAGLMVALLREAGYTASYVYGKIRLDPAQLTDWLGVAGDANAVGRLLGSAGIPAQIWTYSGGALAYVDLDHVWVKVNLEGADYVFDPSFKAHAETAPIDLAAAMGYDQAGFLSQALAGATQGNDYIQHVNRTNTRQALTDYATRLIDHIRTTQPGAAVADIIGGRHIAPAGEAPRQTSHPQQQAVTAEWSEIPAQYQTTLRIQHLGIDQTFDSSAIYGRRFTLFYNSSNQPLLHLTGNLIATGTAATPDTLQEITFSVDHPYAANSGKYQDQTKQQQIQAGGSYFISNGWGGMGRGLVEKHRQALKQYRHSGQAEDSEPVLGETLALIAYHWIAEGTRASDLSDQLAQAATLHHHWVGIAGQASAPYVDLPLNSVSVVSLTDDPAVPSASFFSSAGQGSALEHGVIEQTQPYRAVSTVKLLDIASGQDGKIFDVTSANYAAIKPQLVNYSANEFSWVEAYLNAGYRVLLPQEGNLGVDDWSGIGFLAISSDERAIGHIISGGLKGGFAGEKGPADPGVAVVTAHQGIQEKATPKSADPIDLVSGAFLYSHDDLTMGSGALPLGLGFQRYYTSGARLQDGLLGLGWTHNFAISATLDSDGYQGLGEDSPVDAAAVIAATYTALDILKSSKAKDRLIIAALIQRWFMDALTDNVVRVTQPGNTQQFVQLPDGSYNPPPGDASTLTQDGDGSYRLRTKQGVVLDFDTAGQIATWLDPNENSLAFGYTSGQLTTVANNYGRTLTLGYVNGRLDQVSDETGRSVRYGYDGQQLTTFTNAEQETLTYHYDASRDGLLTDIYTAERPHPDFPPFVSNVYDTLERVKQQKNAAEKRYDYYFAGSRSEEVDPLGHARVWYYDRHGKPLLAIDAEGHATAHAYDGQQRRVRTTLPEGNALAYTYDARHNVETLTHHPRPGFTADPLREQYYYEPAFNRLKQHIDPRGHTTDYYYDTLGNLERVEHPAVKGVRPTTVNTYYAKSDHTFGAYGKLQIHADPEQRTTKYEYDTATGDLRFVTVDPAGFNLRTEFGYDAVGNLTAKTDPRGHTTTLAPYDKARRLKESVAPAPFNYRTRYTYYKDGRLWTIARETRDAAQPWQITEITYTPTGKRETVTDAEDDITRYAYDAADRLWQLTDGELRVTEYRYDPVGRLAQTLEGVGTPEETLTAEYGYTLNGQRETVTDGNTNPTTYHYDGFDRLERTVYPDQSYEQLGYDAAGNIETRRTRAGALIGYGYDPLNRLASKTPPEAPRDIEYHYDLSSRLVDIIDARGTLHHGYDTAGRLEQVTTPDSKTVGYGYDRASNRNRLTYPDSYFVTYRHDALNRLDKVYESDNENLLLADYQYDALSRRDILSYGNGATLTYHHQLDDDLAALDHTLGSNTVNFGYLYNAAGQRTDQSASPASYLWYPALGPLTDYVPNNLNQYDSVNGITFAYDGNGNLTGDGINTYLYDTESQLKTATTPAHAASYTYDTTGRRITKSVDGVTSTYLYDEEQVIAEYDAAGQLQTRYIYGPGIDEPILMDKGGARYYYHFDGQGSVIALTNTAGLLVESYAYSPFGESSDSSGSGNPYRYTGRRLDPETGLYYYRARYYSAALGRFLQPDPIGYADGLNLYAYVGNDPLNFIDPWGLAARSTSWDLANIFPEGAPIVTIGRTFGALAAYAQGVTTGDEILTSVALEGLSESRQANTDTLIILGTLGRGKGPKPNNGFAQKHGGTRHNDAIVQRAKQLRQDPSVSNIRTNQQQVDVSGNKVGTNRPDLQYDKGGCHYCVEYDTVPRNSTRHGNVIRQNDPKVRVELNQL